MREPQTHERDIHDARVSVLVAYTPRSYEPTLSAFANGLGHATAPLLQRAAGARWSFEMGEAYRLANSDSRYPSDFLREALLRMVQGPADIVLVVTNATLISTSERVVPGLAAPETNVAVISAHKLLTAPFSEPVRSLDSESVRWNGAALLAHLMGHLLGLDHAQEGVMAPFSFDTDRRTVPPFEPQSVPHLHRAVDDVIERESEARGTVQKLRIHLVAGVRHPRDVLAPSLRTPAPLLPLYLSRVTAAAVTPTFIILFTDECWWVGLHLDRLHLWSAALVVILTGTWFIPASQRLFFPHREKRVITHHVALLNLAILTAIFLMMVSLLILVMLLVLLVEW